MTSEDTPTRRWRSRGYLVTMATVLSLAGGLALTVLGLGSADQAVASFDAASWVWSRGKGEVARINGVTAKVDTRVRVPRGLGHQLQISQNDRFVILRDVQTGAIGSLDLTNLQEFWDDSTSSGLGVRVALHEDAVFVIDAVQGQVRQIDPRTLGSIGEALRFPPGITGGVFDGTGKLWIAAPSEGTVTAIEAADTPSAGGPRVTRTESVAAQSHDLILSTLDDGVAVLDRTTNVLSSVSDKQPGVPKPVTLPLTGPGALAPRTDGKQVPVTVPDSRHVWVVGDQGVRADFAVPGEGDQLEPAVAWQGFFYVADEATGSVHVFDSAGAPQKDIDIPNPGGPLELEVREGYLFINAPGSSTARVVDEAHKVRTVDKYAQDVLGGDPPKTPPTPPPPPKPKKPVVSQPGAPRNVRAAAGNAEVRVMWQAAAANGAAITRYVVEGAGKTFQVGAGQRSVTVTGLVNGETYQFAVHAVNKKGDGPTRRSNSVKPTADVPDAPTAVTAQARPDGTVVVSWPPANGQGLDIRRYTVSAISEGGSGPIGDAAKNELVIKAGQLEYGTQYAFSVVSINERGAGSKPSPVSASVVPFTKPGKPVNVDAATVGDQAGAVRVAWEPAADNGRPISKYVVAAGGKSTEVTGATSATLTGFGAGQTVAVEVRAVNEAGPGDPGTATARTVATPRVTVTGVNPSFNAATVTFSVDAGGGSATCTVAASGGGSASGGCTSLTVSGLKASTAYTFTVTAKNAAGSATATGKATTDALFGVATCKNGAEGDTATYCDADVSGRNGNEVFSVTRQDNDKQVGWAKPGTRLQAYCKKSGEEVFAFIYNNQKRSTWWVQVNYDGRNYIPWAWLNLDGGDDLNDLANC